MRKVLFALVIIGSISPAWAVDFSAPIKDAENKPIPTCADKTPECERPFTLGRAAATALFASYPDEEAGPRSAGQAIAADEKVKRARLAMDIINGGQHDLKAEDVVLIKKVVGKAFPPLVVMRIWDALDPGAKP